MSIKSKLYRGALAMLLVSSACGAGEIDEQRPDLWFPVGEQLTYKVYWGIFPVAETRVTTRWIEEEAEEKKWILLAIKITTKSYALLDTIYPVNDFIESVVDPAAFTPLRFTRRLSEGRYRLNEVTLFNHKKHIARWKHLVKNDTRDFAVEDDTRDLLSFMYFMRSQKFKPDQTYHYRVMADEKLYDLYVNTKSYVQLNTSKFGPVRCLYIQPEAKFQGFFVRVGRLQAWISDDKRCLCVKAVAKAPIIGTIKLLLDKVEGPGNDSWVKRNQTRDPRQTNNRNNGDEQNAD